MLLGLCLGGLLGVGTLGPIGADTRLFHYERDGATLKPWNPKFSIGEDLGGFERRVWAEKVPYGLLALVASGIAAYALRVSTLAPDAYPLWAHVFIEMTPTPASMQEIFRWDQARRLVEQAKKDPRVAAGVALCKQLWDKVRPDR